MKLRDKTALVTGGSRGIGKAVAAGFLREGARVTICARHRAELEQAGEELSHLGDVGWLQADIARREDVAALAAYVGKRLGALHILVNNAGSGGVRARIEDYPLDTWQEVMQANVNAVFMLTQAVLPLMKRSAPASIINVSSGVGKKGKALWGAYSVSKFALEGFTQTLAEEMKSDRIRVNSVNPGATRTKMRALAYPQENPLSLPTPDACVPLFVYLASDASKETGEYFEVREWLSARGTTGSP